MLIFQGVHSRKKNGGKAGGKKQLETQATHLLQHANGLSQGIRGEAYTTSGWEGLTHRTYG